MMTRFPIVTWIYLISLISCTLLALEPSDSDNSDNNLDAPTLTIMFNEFVEK